jgi:GNAT superfamily N-acetyltransferase
MAALSHSRDPVTTFTIIAATRLGRATIADASTRRDLANVATEDGTITTMSEIAVRVAREDEVDKARSILGAAYAEYEGSFPKENWAPYLVDILDLEGRAAASELLIAERVGKIVGCVSYFPPGSKASYPSDSFSEPWPTEWAAFRLLAVDPAARGGGVGRRLTEVCIERARQQGAPAVGLHTTEPMKVARAMYERLGFERAPRYDFHPSPQVAVEAYRLDL